MTRRPFFISSQTNLLIRNSIYMQGIRIDVRSARMKRGLIVCVGVFRVYNVTDRACFLEADEQKKMEIKSSEGVQKMKDCYGETILLMVAILSLALSEKSH